MPALGAFILARGSKPLAISIESGILCIMLEGDHGCRKIIKQPEGEWRTGWKGWCWNPSDCCPENTLQGGKDGGLASS